MTHAIHSETRDLHRVEKTGRVHRAAGPKKNPKGTVDFYTAKGGRVGIDMCVPGLLASEILAVMAASEACETSYLYWFLASHRLARLCTWRE